MVEGQLVIRPIVTIKQDLAHLLSGITEANLHNECDTGEAVGIENW
jgi:antitoxin component of MazEF toxin-antitoxin module